MSIDRDASNRQWAISVLEEIETENIEQDRAISIAVDALREKQEREQGCKCCHSSALERVGVDTASDKPRIYLCGGNNQPPKEEQFCFCPKCGRKLECAT